MSADKSNTLCVDCDRSNNCCCCLQNDANRTSLAGFDPHNFRLRFKNPADDSPLFTIIFKGPRGARSPSPTKSPSDALCYFRPFDFPEETSHGCAQREASSMVLFKSKVMPPIDWEQLFNLKPDSRFFIKGGLSLFKRPPITSNQLQYWTCKFGFGANK